MAKPDTQAPTGAPISLVDESFASKVIDSLIENIAVIDEKGFIVAVNKAWRMYAQENSTDKTGFVGTNYLSICEDAIRRDDDDLAKSMYRGLQAVIRHEQDGFSFEYPCHSPDVKRWFIARVTRFLHDSSTYLVIAHEDITSRKLAEETLRERDSALRLVLEALPIGVWIMDKEGRIVHGNPQGLKIWAGARFVKPDQFAEYKGWWLSSGKPIAADEWAAARAIQKGETSIDEEIVIECFDGSKKIILNSAIPLRNDNSDITGAIVVNQDITARKSDETKLIKAKTAIEEINRELQDALTREQVKARTDPLTGIYNRRHFFEVAVREFGIAQRYKLPFSILLFDIDHFKNINDTFGHQAGDDVLVRVAQIARHHLRETDLLARYGGEEFIISLPDTTAEQTMIVAERIRLEISEQNFETKRGRVKATISVGIAQNIPADRTLDRLVSRSDQAMYLAKNSGRNRIMCF